MSLSCFFFFKQKTAYEMRISDWSSDVCSSDLIFVYNSANSGEEEVRKPAEEQVVIAELPRELPRSTPPIQLAAPPQRSEPELPPLPMDRQSRMPPPVTYDFPQGQRQPKLIERRRDSPDGAMPEDTRRELTPIGPK